MTKNRSIKIAVLVLALALITSCFVGTTFAKYTSSGDGSSSARVALWKVTTGAAGTAAIDGADSVVFDLFDTIKDTDGSAETDVKDGGAENIVAPGTQGSFDLVIKNASEVTAAYGITFELTNAGNVPLEFKVGEGTWKSTLDNVALNADSESDANTILAMGTGTDTVTVNWRWAFGTGSTDAADTALGEAGTATVTVKATVTAEQID